MQTSYFSLIGSKADEWTTVCLTSARNQAWGDALIFVRRKGICIDESRVPFQFKQCFSEAGVAEKSEPSPCRKLGRRRWARRRRSGTTFRVPFLGVGEPVCFKVPCSCWQASICSPYSPGKWPFLPGGLGRRMKGRQSPGSGQADTTKRKHLLWETYLTDDLFLP